MRSAKAKVHRSWPAPLVHADTHTHTQPCSVISRENTSEITSLSTIITAGLDVFKLGKGLRSSTDTQKRESACA